jgi:hypothetical protein
LRAVANIPPCVTEILVGRNEPTRNSISRECQLYLRSYWLVPAHQDFRHTGRDVTWATRRSSSCDDLSYRKDRWLINCVFSAASHYRLINNSYINFLLTIWTATRPRAIITHSTQRRSSCVYEPRSTSLRYSLPSVISPLSASCCIQCRSFGQCCGVETAHL